MSSPIQVIALANAAALGVFVLCFTLPGTPTKNTSWNRVKTILTDSSTSALTLIPALSVLVLPEPSSLNYVLVGTGSWLTGIAVGQAAPGCTSSGVGTGCSKSQFSAYQLSKGLQTMGASFLVGSLLAYIKDMKLE